MKNNRFGQAKVLDTQELNLVIKYLKTENQKVLASGLNLWRVGDGTLNENVF